MSDPTYEQREGAPAALRAGAGALDDCIKRIETLEDYIDNLANRGVAPASEWRRQGGPGGQEAEMAVSDHSVTFGVYKSLNATNVGIRVVGDGVWPYRDSCCIDSEDPSPELVRSVKFFMLRRYMDVREAEEPVETQHE